MVWSAEKFFSGLCGGCSGIVLGADRVSVCCAGLCLSGRSMLL